MRVSTWGGLALLGAIASSSAGAQSDTIAPAQTSVPGSSTPAWPTWNGQLLLDSKIFEMGPAGPAVQGLGGARIEMQNGSFFVILHADDYQKNIKPLRITQSKEQFTPRNTEALFFESIDKPYWIVITKRVSNFARKVESDPLRGHCSPYDNRNRGVIDFRGTLNECTSALAEPAPVSAGGAIFSIINLGTDRMSGDFDRQYTATNVNALVQGAFAVDPSFSHDQVATAVAQIAEARQRQIGAASAAKQERQAAYEAKCAGQMDGDEARAAAIPRALAVQQICIKRGYANLPGAESARARCAQNWARESLMFDSESFGCGAPLQSLCPGERKAKIREGNWLRTGGAITPQDTPFYFEMEALSSCR